jgi:four helix bundle protein
MANILNFEDLKAWQKARELASLVYSYTKKEAFSRDFGLKDQIQRAAGSIMHNLAEGFEAGTDLEKSRFFIFARRSASEVQSELYLALDAKYISQVELKHGYDLAVEIKKMIFSLLNYLKRDKSVSELEGLYDPSSAVDS